MSSTAPMTRTARYATVAVAVTGLTALLTACSGSGSGTVTVGGSANPAAGSTPVVTAGAAEPSTAAAEPVGDTPAGSTGSTGKVKGCSASNNLKIPAGAGTAKTADLDGDGKKDTIWLALDGDQGQASLGVRTASGAGFGTRVSIVSDRSNKVSAVAGVVSGGVPVILLSNGTVSVFSAAGCEIRPTLNKQGEQYTFKADGKAPTYDSGVGCPSIGSTGSQLVGYHAKWYADGAEYRVTRTTVRLSEDGTSAANGSTTTVKEVASDGDPVLTRAQSVSCTGGTAKL
jgi:hypothetical protein